MSEETIELMNKQVTDLHAAKKDKKNEFYTQLTDIEKEIKYHEKHFKNKTVFCNCDDPKISNFFKFFSLKFNQLGLKKLITTCYKSQQVDMFSESKSERAIFLEYHGEKRNGKVPTARQIGIKRLRGDGDFRSPECIELLKQSDIVVTNPPFTHFREYVLKLLEHKKKFVIMGKNTAVGYKEIFPLLQDNKIWLGPSIKSGDREFGVPKDYEIRSPSLRLDEHGNQFIRVVGIRWFTNLDFKQRYEDLILYKKYSPKEYPKYDNYDAINVDVTKEIPKDYKGIMGVPLTFMDKYNPEQFEILGLSQKVGFGLESNKNYNDYGETKPDGTKTGSSGRKTNGNPMLKGMPKKKGNNFYVKGNKIVHSLFGRIFIRNKRL